MQIPLRAILRLIVSNFFKTERIKIKMVYHNISNMRDKPFFIKILYLLRFPRSFASSKRVIAFKNCSSEETNTA